jgi:lipid-binding SYLF domain-containing protein
MDVARSQQGDVTMRYKLFVVALGLLALAGLVAPPVNADDKYKDKKVEETRDIDEVEELTESREALKKVMAIPEDGIPQDMLEGAAAIVVVPDMVKAAFVAGAQHGDGVMVVRNGNGWSAPIFVELTGGSVGFQAGVQSTDVVLVFKNASAAKKVLDGEFTLGADGSIAAGPVGRDAKAGTDVKLDQEVYSYSRSKGLFAGVSLDGSKLSINKDGNAAYYGKQFTSAAAFSTANVTLPAEAKGFVDDVTMYTTKKKS